LRDRAPIHSQQGEPLKKLFSDKTEFAMMRSHKDGYLNGIVALMCSCRWGSTLCRA
jgi:hypothetical protein